MNVVKILLVLGLGYVAMTQKVEKTRNMLLVVTGLLAFCMFSVEGFDSITFTAGADGTGDGSTAQTAANPVLATGGTGELTVGGQITSTGSRVYTFPVGFNVGTGVGEVGYTCGANEVKGAMVNSGSLSAETVEAAFPCVSKQLCSATPATLTCSSGTKKSGDSDYCAGSACASDDFSGSSPACCQLPAPNETCEAGKTRLPAECPEYYMDKAGESCAGSTCSSSDFSVSSTTCCTPAPNETCEVGKTRMSAKCPKYYKDKAGENCAAATCVAADFSTTTQKCCTAPCSDDNCHWYNLFGDGADCGSISKCDE